MTDSLQDYLTDEQDKFLEEMFSAAVILKKEKKKITVHLEDGEGNTLQLKEISRNFHKFLTDKLSFQDDIDLSTADNKIANSVFPLMNQLAATAMPRIAGPQVASLMFMAPDLRAALVTYGMMVFLLNQYINQNKLKIVKTMVDITDEELEKYMQSQRETEERLQKAFFNEDA